MKSDDPKLSVGVVDRSLYTRFIALKDDCNKKRTDTNSYAPAEFNYVQTLAKILLTFLQDRARSLKKHV